MTASKLSSFYTFRPLNERLWEVVKWEETGDGVLGKYIVDVVTNHCSCPAPSDCKHKSCVQEILEMDTVYEMYRWKWDEQNQWTELFDIISVEELEDGR